MHNNDIAECYRTVDDIPLPDGLLLSTMTLNCEFKNSYNKRIRFNIENIGLYLDIDNIYKMEYYSYVRINNKLQEDYIAKNKKRKYVKKKLIKRIMDFYNQITLIVVGETNIINVKLFINGSIQMAGCTSIREAERILKMIIDKLNQDIYIFENGEMTQKKFINDETITKIDLDNISRFSVSMINTNFNIGFKINRDNLFLLLVENNRTMPDMTVRYDPTIHAGVILSIPCTNKKRISIFVFESGAIIITGSKNNTQVINTYDYIYNFLNEYKREVKKIIIDINKLKNKKLKKL